MPGKSANCSNGYHDDCNFFVSFFCDCDCHKGGMADITEKCLTTVAGVGMAVGGLAITIGTLGLAAPVGGALMGAGISSTVHGIEKTLNNERINMVSLSMDMGLGAVTGALTGGIGAAGEVAAAAAVKTGATQVVKAGVVKLGVRAAAGATAGLTAKGLDEVKRSINGEESSSAASWVASAMVGAVGGVGCHVSSNATKAVSSGVTKSLVRVGVSATTAAASDGMIQATDIAIGNQKSYDVKRTVRSVAVSTITTVAAEGVKNSIYQANGGKEKMLHDKAAEKTIKENVPADAQQEYKEQYENLQNSDQQKTDQEFGKAKVVTDRNTINDVKCITNEKFDAKIKKIDQEIMQHPKDSDQRRQMGINRQALVDQKKISNEQLKNFQSAQPNVNKADIEHLNQGGLKNAHPLVNLKVGQIACDVNPPGTVGRAEGRGIFDHHPSAPEGRKYTPSGYTPDHKYKNTPDFGKSPFYEHQDNYGNKLEVNKNSAIIMLTNASINKKKKKNEHDD